jgi:hypothetical protein
MRAEDLALTAFFAPYDTFAPQECKTKRCQEPGCRTE